MSLTVTGATLDGEPVGLRSVDGVITALGADVRAEPGDDVLDGAGCALVPGLVNGHTHAAMTLFRGYGSDLPLMEWLEAHIWPKEALLTDDDVYWGTRLACLEMIRSGTVRFWDMYWRPSAVARACCRGCRDARRSACRSSTVSIRPAGASCAPTRCDRSTSSPTSGRGCRRRSPRTGSTR